MKLRDWLRERELNARRIASGKRGEDRAGWLEDADYFKRAAEAVDELERRKAADGVTGRDGQTFSGNTPMVSGDSEANKEKG